MPRQPEPLANPSVSRRRLLKTSIGAGAALAAVDGLTLAAARRQAPRKKVGVVLFQGDSITDAGRNRKDGNPNSPSALGRGYPFHLGGQLLADHPQSEVKVFNRGISGHKVPDLDARWQRDTIDLKPDVLSILVGVNDIWHKLAGRYSGTVEDYEIGFTALLEKTRAALPEVRLVVCEPFVLRCGAVKDNWFPEFDQRRAAAKRVCEAAKATWVAFQSMFDDAAKAAGPAYWAGDGVHPTLAGHALMAKAWREAVGL